MRRIEDLETTQYNYYRVLKQRSTAERSNRVVVPTLPNLRGQGSSVAAFSARAKYLQNLQLSNSLRSVGGQNVQFTAGFISTDIASDAMAQAGRQTAQALSLFIASMAEASTRKTGLARIHQEMANRAHEAVNFAYQGRFGDADRYRVGMNREAGKLGPALASKKWLAATADGVLFMDRAYLDRAAKHWYRLNFGAQPAGKSRSAKVFPIKFGGQSLGGLTLNKNRASRPFMIPKGVWIKEGGVQGPDRFRSRNPGDRGRRGDSFYPAKMYYDYVANVSGPAAGALVKSLKVQNDLTNKKSGKLSINPAKMTRGIRGAHFFDAGVKSLAKDMGPAYEGLLERWKEEAQVSGSGPVAKVIARP